MDRDRRKVVYFGIIINILTVVLTMCIYGLLLKHLHDIAKWLAFMGLIITFGLYVIIAFGQLIQLGKSIKEEEKLEFLKGIPEVLYFQERTDNFMLCSNGDVIIEWKFKIKKKTSEKITYVNFPFKYESDIKSEDPIEIVEARVNCVEPSQPVEYFPEREVRERGESEKKNPTFEGTIRVPLCSDTDENDKGFNVSIKIKIKGVNSDGENFIVLDIPYLTKNMTVIVQTNNENDSIIKLGKELLSVQEPNGKNVDYQEIVNQKKNIKLNANRIIWETKYPKLGYQYKIKYYTE